ncbi:hypothetical protein FB451DRAFT_1398440 [Mycena latifolia]|nr:hypothetical protein FB451DRAFT_1398440 [Mycena latifolia]
MTLPSFHPTVEPPNYTAFIVQFTRIVSLAVLGLSIFVVAAPAPAPGDIKVTISVKLGAESDMHCPQGDCNPFTQEVPQCKYWSHCPTNYECIVGTCYEREKQENTFTLVSLC